MIQSDSPHSLALFFRETFLLTSLMPPGKDKLAQESNKCHITLEDQRKEKQDFVENFIYFTTFYQLHCFPPQDIYQKFYVLDMFKTCLTNFLCFFLYMSLLKLIQRLFGVAHILSHHFQGRGSFGRNRTNKVNIVKGQTCVTLLCYNQIFYIV